MATQYDPTTFSYQNFYSALLTSDITSGTLTINLDTVPSPTSAILVIDPDSSTSREVIFYTSKGASTITCPSDGRGWAGSTPAAHLTGTTVIMAPIDEYFKALAIGTLSTDPLRTTLISNYVVSGGVVAISSGLIGTFSNITFYLNGQRYSGTSIANKTYTASKDTYVDVTAVSGGTVSVLYTEVANGATAPALTTNYVRIAKVITSGAAITSIVQNPFSDGVGNYFRNIAPISSYNLNNPVKFSVHKAADQTGIADNTPTKINFDTKKFDTGNNFDVTTNVGRFTAPVAGFYQINAYGYVLSTANNGFTGYIHLYKNGSIIQQGGGFYPAAAGATLYFAAHISHLVQLAAGDYLEIYAQFDVNTGTVTVVGTAVDTSFSGYLVSQD